MLLLQAVAKIAWVNISTVNMCNLGTLIIKLDRPKTLLKSHKLNLDFVEVNDSVESRRMPFRIHLLDGKSILDTGSRVQIFDVQISFKVS
jgi:hypothetical protein